MLAILGGNCREMSRCCPIGAHVALGAVGVDVHEHRAVLIHARMIGRGCQRGKRLVLIRMRQLLCPEDEHAEFVELHIRREQRWAEVLRHLIEAEPADLVAVMFDGVDKLQHLCWRFIDPACRPERPSAWEREMIERCDRYFHSLDQLIEAVARIQTVSTAWTARTTAIV